MKVKNTGTYNHVDKNTQETRTENKGCLLTDSDPWTSTHCQQLVLQNRIGLKIYHEDLPKILSSS